jgi:predicted nucleotidyltransferase
VERSRAWWHSRSREFLSDCARLIVRLIGRDAIEAVYLCGSFAGGDESIVLETDPPLLLSDVDLVAVVKSIEALTRWRGRRAELGAACEELWKDVRVSGTVDVGVMLPRDLAAMSAKPGVYDMLVLGKVLEGNPGILEEIPRYAPSDITAREAIVLIENRAVSLLDARPGSDVAGEAEPYRFLYRIARVYTDIAAAALSIVGAYVPGYGARAVLIRERAGTEATDELARLVDPGLAGNIERWTAFKLEPSLGAAGMDGGSRALDGIWAAAAADLLAFWKRAVIAAIGQRNEGTGAAVTELSGMVGASGGPRDNLRGWRSYLSGLAPARRIALCAALGPGLLRRNPLDVIRDEGMKLLEHRVVRGRDVPVRGGRGGFPHRAGAWDRAAEDLCAAWNALVFGRPNG